MNVFWKLVQGKVSYDHANWLSSWSMRHLKKWILFLQIFLYSDLHIHCTAIAQIQIEVISYLFHFRLINTHWTFSSMITYYYKDEKVFIKQTGILSGSSYFSLKKTHLFFFKQFDLNTQVLIIQVVFSFVLKYKHFEVMECRKL